jgi:hypothetical protein
MPGNLASATLARETEAVASDGRAAWRCSCGAELDQRTWSSLALLARVEPSEIRRVALNWPTHLEVQVRQCGTCGAKIARKVPTDSEGAIPDRTTA